MYFNCIDITFLLYLLLGLVGLNTECVLVVAHHLSVPEHGKPLAQCTDMWHTGTIFFTASLLDI